MSLPNTSCSNVFSIGRFMVVTSPQTVAPSPASQLIHSQRCGASQSPRFWQGWAPLPSTAQIPFWEGWSAASLKMACCPLLDTRFWVESPAKCLWMVTSPASSRLGCEFCGLRPISILQTSPLDAVTKRGANSPIQRKNQDPLSLTKTKKRFAEVFDFFHEASRLGRQF